MFVQKETGTISCTFLALRLWALSSLIYIFSTSSMGFVISNWIISKMHGKEAWKANGLAGMAARDPKIYRLLPQ